MGELIKLIVDLLVLKDARDKGTFSWFAICVGLGVTVVVFAVGLLVAGYYDRHPEAGSGPIIGVLVFTVVTLGSTCLWGWRYQNRLAASRKAVPSR
jgi:hypothetical protein